MNDLYDALAEVPSFVLPGPRGMTVQISKSKLLPTHCVVVIFSPLEEDVQHVIDGLHGHHACFGFIPPVRCAPSMYVSMGRVR